MTATIRLQKEAFDIGAEVAALARGRSDIGAVVTFTGICRTYPLTSTYSLVQDKRCSCPLHQEMLAGNWRPAQLARDASELYGYLT